MIPKVSVLIPLFNSEEFIAQTIQSVLDQTWKNLEIIIVDDGSTDNSYAVAKSFEAEQVQIYKQINKGACAARNFAFSVSTGDYIQYLDADDLISPRKIESQLLSLQMGVSEAVASCLWGRFYNSVADFIPEHKEINKHYGDPIDWLVDSWNGKGMGQTGIWLTPTSLVKKAGPWNENLKINQDGDFFARILLHARKIIYCPEATVFYRSSNNNSISQAAFTEGKAQSLLYSYKQNVKSIPNKLMTKEVRQALARNFAEIIYRFHEHYPMVCAEAWSEIAKLEVKEIEPVGGRIFRILTKFFGFSTAHTIRVKIKI